MKTVLPALPLVLALLTWMCAPNNGQAGIFYQYTGKPFTYTDPILGAPWVGGHMSALVEISNPTGNEKVGNGCRPSCAKAFDSWSLSAGPWTITDRTPNVDDVTPFFVTLSADASIVDFWSLAAFIPRPPDEFGDFLETTFDGHVPPDGAATIDLVFQWGATLAKVGPNDAGTWVRLLGRPIPEPASLTLLGLGLAGLGVARRRNSTKASRFKGQIRAVLLNCCVSSHVGRCTRWSTAALAMVLLYIANSQAAPFFLALDNLPEKSWTIPFDISADGTTVVGYTCCSPGAHHPVIWDATHGLRLVPGTDWADGGIAWAISSDATRVLVRSEKDGQLQDYIWSSIPGVTKIVPPAGVRTSSYDPDISGNGEFVAMTIGSPGHAGATRWSDIGGFEPLGDMSGRGSVAAGISYDGRVIVGTSAVDDISAGAFVWKEGDGIRPLGNLPDGKSSFGMVVSDDGLVVGGYDTIEGQVEAFRWTEAGGLEGLGFEGIPYGISADGEVIVGCADASALGLPPPTIFGRECFQFDSEAFLWSGRSGFHFLRNLIEEIVGTDLTGWRLGAANAVSDDGLVLAGFATDPDGVTRAFIADLRVPEPATLALLGLGLAGLGVARRHHIAVRLLGSFNDE